ncbi:hypothetical protein scyTo_0026517 [Scyliorhinus torazame]|uniref:Uncharacterized protein n=1 Tax=Scyliorhinus torazame TaxID=75743 RepID=A0A401QKR3_SCYTO|nr:hypothetical protein [Scyliorhinus torazame]
MLTRRLVSNLAKITSDHIEMTVLALLLLQADEAEATYRTCIADAKTQKQELEDVKVNVLRQIQEIIKQSDQTLKSVRTPSFTQF